MCVIELALWKCSDMQSDVKFLLTGMPEYCGQNEPSVRTFEPVFTEDAPTDYVHLNVSPTPLFLPESDKEFTIFR